ncbi:radical SAM protein [Streptomyces sp. UNOB3_S3]|uniref:radical SAM protein n=1 Tax=Streptomyces sp. UNOB3_S3 TaxID=2871682 RepID=UPI001E513EA6|nr:radical SAM protein [Streptomyces sp. UNOB3_S3]MCC3778237.1 radical SAM protein [Streptomyces sp. UNOB3_S3]
MKENSGGPTDIIWEITYACPLRCSHCYSESGRRPSRHLKGERLLELTDALIALRPRNVVLAGGEPLVVKGVLDVARRFTDAGVRTALYTSGWNIDRAKAEAILTTFPRTAVSLDGTTAEVHNRIRGRDRSFDRAMNALRFLDEASRELTARDVAHGTFGIDCSVMRSNLGQLDEFCARIAPLFPAMRTLVFGLTVPGGLASREEFAEHELLDDEQVARLTGRERTRQLRSLAPAGLSVMVDDNMRLLMRPDDIAANGVPPVLQVEPDGDVRAMSSYLGTVANVLRDAPETIWERVAARCADPFVVETLGGVRTMGEWAAAARRLDLRFGSAADRARIAARTATDLLPAPSPARS